MHIRAKRFLPKRQMEPAPLFELDADTMDWMRTHNVDDLTSMAIAHATEGKNSSKAALLATELTKLEWKTGLRDDVAGRLESLEYYTPKTAAQRDEFAVV